MKLFKKFYVYVLENGRKKNVVCYTVPKIVSKKSVIEHLRLKSINYDGIDSVYPAI